MQHLPASKCLPGCLVGCGIHSIIFSICFLFVCFKYGPKANIEIFYYLHLQCKLHLRNGSTYALCFKLQCYDHIWCTHNSMLLDFVVVINWCHLILSYGEVAFLATTSRLNKPMHGVVWYFILDQTYIFKQNIEYRNKDTMFA